MLSCTSKRSHRHTILHVSFSNSFGLASARPTPQGLSGAPISFREEEIATYIAEKTKLITPNVCLDPTLLLDTNDWESLINNFWESRKYVAVYQVRGNKQQQQYVLDVANRISKEIGNDIEVIDLSSMKYSGTVANIRGLFL